MADGGQIVLGKFIGGKTVNLKCFDNHEGIYCTLEDKAPTSQQNCGSIYS